VRSALQRRQNTTNKIKMSIHVVDHFIQAGSTAIAWYFICTSLTGAIVIPSILLCLRVKENKKPQATAKEVTARKEPVS
jgi:hypothetical protein